MFDRQNYIKDDSPIKKTLLKLFKKSDELILFDVGACEGEESIRYKKIFPESSVFLFEPLPSNQQLITENIEKYKLENLFKTIELNEEMEKSIMVKIFFVNLFF